MVGMRVVFVLALVAAAAAATMAAEEEVMSLYQPRDPCPQVERIVRDAVNEEFFNRNNKQITAGFLRVFFHDCFSAGGCDASILLDGEWDAGVNRNSVQPRVRELVNEIRRRVERECPAGSVSCADILALATRDSVAAAKGPNVPIPRGRFDSKRPSSDINQLPRPDQSIDTLLGLFTRFGLRNPADLVALSGGHTVGRTRICPIVRPNLRPSCNANRIQMLDVITPDEFDNQYFVGLTRNQGVFDSDQNLFNHPATQSIVRDFANNKQSFFNQWAASFAQLSRTNWATAANGEIRRDCTRPNGRISSIIDEAFAATA